MLNGRFKSTDLNDLINENRIKPRAFIFENAQKMRDDITTHNILPTYISNFDCHCERLSLSVQSILYRGHSSAELCLRKNINNASIHYYSGHNVCIICIENILKADSR